MRKKNQPSIFKFNSPQHSLQLPRAAGAERLVRETGGEASSQRAPRVQLCMHRRRAYAYASGYPVHTASARVWPAPPAFPA